MNPEMIHLAEEQTRRMFPDDLAGMHERPEDPKLAARQLDQTRREEMLSMARKFAADNPEEFAAMKAQADAQSSHAVTGAKTVKRDRKGLIVAVVMLILALILLRLGFGVKSTLRVCSQLDRWFSAKPNKNK
ncbi:hypothetical protein CFC21_081474 [Triticum aestivum]|uniref:Uncharacterized protein n=2 Tax=Triticum aestivum TaxID=4565 RepID=A0A9R1I4H3_WHEAT|nr:hypothetical protein CFC21_081474 [Triticum aestivum]